MFKNIILPIYNQHKIIYPVNYYYFVLLVLFTLFIVILYIFSGNTPILVKILSEDLVCQPYFVDPVSVESPQATTQNGWNLLYVVVGAVVVLNVVPYFERLYWTVFPCYSSIFFWRIIVLLVIFYNYLLSDSRSEYELYVYYLKLKMIGVAHPSILEYMYVRIHLTLDNLTKN